jgi:hypothetical protein
MAIHQRHSSKISIDRLVLIHEVSKGYNDFDELKTAIDAAKIIQDG